MRKLPREKRALVLAALTEGLGVNATARFCGVSKLTVRRLLAEAGSLAMDFHNGAVRDLPTVRVEVDQVWSFVGCKQKTKDSGRSTGHGDAWCWTAIDADHKVIVAYAVGERTGEYARAFLHDWTALDHVDMLEAREAAAGGRITDYPPAWVASK